MVLLDSFHVSPNASASESTEQVLAVPCERNPVHRQLPNAQGQQQTPGSLYADCGWRSISLSLHIANAGACCFGPACPKLSRCLKHLRNAVAVLLAWASLHCPLHPNCAEVQRRTWQGAFGMLFHGDKSKRTNSEVSKGEAQGWVILTAKRSVFCRSDLWRVRWSREGGEAVCGDAVRSPSRSASYLGFLQPFYQVTEMFLFVP